MCHASRRERERTRPFFLHWHEPGRDEHHERGERGGCFMPPPPSSPDADGFEGRSAFGVRRPLRFLAHKLDLDEKQITELVRILDDVKTERAQAEMDDRRALAEFADAVAGETFDAAKAACRRSPRPKRRESSRHAHACP